MAIAQAIYPTRNAFFLITFLQFQLSLLFLFEFSKNRWLNFNKSYTIVSVPENHFQRKIAFQRWSSGGWEFPTVVQIQCNTFEFAVFFFIFFRFFILLLQIKFDVRSFARGSEMIIVVARVFEAEKTLVCLPLVGSDYVFFFIFFVK